MKILFVEDDDVKRSRISQLLSDTVPSMNLIVARSLQSGLRKLKEDRYSVIILDMTLPNYDPGPNEPGGKPQLFGGREFLRQMDRYDVPTPVIVVTQFAAFGQGSQLVDLNHLDSELRQEHRSIYRGAVYYNSAVQSWMSDLSKLLKDVLKETQGEDSGR